MLLNNHPFKQYKQYNDRQSNNPTIKNINRQSKKQRSKQYNKNPIGIVTFVHLYASLSIWPIHIYMGHRDQDGKKVDEMSLFFLK